MSKRNYTHIKGLLPTTQTMVAEGMTQREIAEHFGFKDKQEYIQNQLTSDQIADQMGLKEFVDSFTGRENKKA